MSQEVSDYPAFRDTYLKYETSNEHFNNFLFALINLV